MQHVLSEFTEIVLNDARSLMCRKCSSVNQIIALR